MTGKQARRRQLLRTIGLRFSGMDVLKALGLYLVAVMCCLLLRSFDMHNDTSYVAMIFLLDVFLTAYWTGCSAWTSSLPTPSGISALR